MSVSDPVSASMNFLNEVAGRFPDAISLAAGRPYDGSTPPTTSTGTCQLPRRTCASAGLSAAQRRTAADAVRPDQRPVGGLIARMLAIDEDIHVPAEAVMVTTGCQEAMVIALRGLCAGPGDVVLAAEPCYVGFTGAARLLGIEVVPVPESPDGLDPETVAAVAAEVRASGRTRGRSTWCPTSPTRRACRCRCRPAGRCSTWPPTADLLHPGGRPVRAVRPRRRAAADAQVARHRPAGHLPGLVRQVLLPRRAGRLPGRRPAGRRRRRPAHACSPRSCRR